MCEKPLLSTFSLLPKISHMNKCLIKYIVFIKYTQTEKQVSLRYADADRLSLGGEVVSQGSCRTQASEEGFAPTSEMVLPFPP